MSEIKNFLPSQYAETNPIEINHNYLSRQFSDLDEIWKKIREVVLRGDFTLGSDVDILENEFALMNGAKYAIGVGSGTDALSLSLKALGIDKGDEVITTPFTFYATIGAIVTSGASPVFSDVGDDYNINPAEIEKKITSRTKAILPVHWSGKPCDIESIEVIARKHNIPIIYDACHAVNAEYKKKKIGEYGATSCFSFHPLKNLNVWGDGGIITTNSDEICGKLRLIRNHGLAHRDECRVFAYNSRLDTVQAVVARHMLEKIDHITSSRINNAAYFDSQLNSIPQIKIPLRDPYIKHVYHLYQFLCERRNELQEYLWLHGVDAKIHYPIPMHLQPAAEFLHYKKGDFPVAEKISDSVISLPVHEFITRPEQDKVIDLIKKFYV